MNRAALAALLGLWACEEERIGPAPVEDFFDPANVEFGEVVIGDVARAFTRFRNTRGEPIRVRGVRFDPPVEVFGAFLRPIGTLNGTELRTGSAVDVELRFGPLEAAEYRATMVVDAGDVRIELPLVGLGRQQRPAEVRPDPALLDFGSVVAGRTRLGRVSLHNGGDLRADIFGVRIQGGGFRLVSGTAASSVPPGGELAVEVRFEPDESDRPYGGQVLVALPSGDLSVPLVGRSLPPASLGCPSQPVDLGVVPRGQVREGRVACEVLASEWSLERVALAAGSAPSFELVGAPRILPSRVESDVRFSAEGATGSQLSVVEWRGSAGDVHRVSVVAETGPPEPEQADLLVTLAWQEGAADLDLHLVRAGGLPFDLRDDCHFRSKNPDWGMAGVRWDDPFLDRDARRGPGPEVVSLMDAAEPSFDVYVQYHDRGEGLGGPVRAEVSWRLRGRGAEQGRELPGCGAWWHVGTVRRGDPPTFELVDALSTDYSSRAAERCQ